MVKCWLQCPSRLWYKMTTSYCLGLSLWSTRSPLYKWCAMIVSLWSTRSPLYKWCAVTVVATCSYPWASPPVSSFVHHTPSCCSHVNCHSHIVWSRAGATAVGPSCCQHPPPPPPTLPTPPTSGVMLLVVTRWRRMSCPWFVNQIHHRVAALVVLRPSPWRACVMCVAMESVRYVCRHGERALCVSPWRACVMCVAMESVRYLCTGHGFLESLSSDLYVAWDPGRMRSAPPLMAVSAPLMAAINGRQRDAMILCLLPSCSSPLFLTFVDRHMLCPTCWFHRHLEQS